MKRFLTLATLLLAPLSFGGRASAATPTPGESATLKQWMQNTLLADKPEKPFSFVYDGKSSSALLNDWKLGRDTREVDAQRREHALTWIDAASGLQVRCIAVEYADFPVAEWTIYLKNTGQKKTPLLESIQGLDTRFERTTDGEFVLHGIRG